MRTRFLVLLTAILSTTFIFTSCASLGGLPEGEEYLYNEGEIVYYKVDQMPMLIEKQLYKKGVKKYEVMFKNAEGELMRNVINEEDLLSTPPANRAKI